MKERNLKFWQIWKVESKVQSINCSIEVQTRQKLRGKNILQSITKWFQYIYKKLQSSIAIFKCKWIIFPFYVYKFKFFKHHEKIWRDILYLHNFSRKYYHVDICQ